MPQILIVGGGISGLYAALLLEQRGVDYLLLEARERFGGRILSTSFNPPELSLESPSHFDSFDLGPTWYWPTLQPQFAALVTQWGLAPFEQQEEGDMLIEQDPLQPPLRVSGFRSVPPLSRISGGMAALIKAITARLPPSRLHLQTIARNITIARSTVVLTATGHNQASSREFHAEKLLLAVPPRLAVSTIRFQPQLPSSLTAEWNSTGTWMAPHAKYLAIYPTPFWRHQGLSGEARSAVGPMGELHDASTPAGQAALFGFLSLSAQERAQLPHDQLKAHCRNQLIRLFGQAAAAPLAESLKDWAQDPCTATPADLHPDPHAAVAPLASPAAGDWQDRIIGIAAEWSPHFPGYLAGAIDAASRGVNAILAT
ncbi:MAG: flavin monoamine oxidase family protein [Acidobacteriaceae bacterium]